MEAFASIVLLVIAMFVYAGFTAVTEKLDEIIERLTPPRHVHDGELSVGQRAALAVRPGTGAPTRLAGNGPSRAAELSAGLYHLLRRLRPGARAALRLAGLIGKCR
jgi:hypothetical protein